MSAIAVLIDVGNVTIAVLLNARKKSAYQGAFCVAIRMSPTTMNAKIYVGRLLFRNSPQCFLNEPLRIDFTFS